MANARVILAVCLCSVSALLFAYNLHDVMTNEQDIKHQGYLKASRYRLASREARNNLNKIKTSPNTDLHQEQTLNNNLIIQNESSEVLIMSESNKIWTAIELDQELDKQLFQVASAFGIAKARASLVCAKNLSQSKLFEVVELTSVIFECPTIDFRVVKEKGFAMHEQSFVTEKGNIIFGPFLQSYKYFYDLPFTLKRKDWAERWVAERGIQVGIHVVRQGDFNNHESGVRIPPAVYFEYCLHQLWQRYGKLQTVVVSDDLEWVRAQSVFSVAILREAGSTAEDMAVLAACPHVISSVGNYGWWAMRFKTKPGECFYYIDMWDFQSAPSLKKRVRAGDYFFPLWTGVSDAELELFESAGGSTGSQLSNGSIAIEQLNHHDVWTGVELMNRLGNQMFQVASAYGIAKTRGSRVCIRGLAGAVFARGVKLKVNMPACPNITFIVVSEKGFAMYDESLAKHEGNIMVGPFMQSFKYFDEVPFELKLKDWAERWVAEHGIQVGIHVRRGDFKRIESGARMPPAVYFEYCLHQLQQRYGKLRILVVSNGMQWVRDQPVFADAVLHEGGPVEDMALLAACPHVISSTGTYGWWGMRLKTKPGECFYYSDPCNYTLAPYLKYVVRLEDIFPPEWTGVGDAELALFQNLYRRDGLHVSNSTSSMDIQ